MVRNQYLCPECGRRVAGVCLGPHERLQVAEGRNRADPGWEIIPKPPLVTGTAPTAGAKALTPGNARGERSRQLRAALAERYPDKLLPRGIAAALAPEFGVSHQRVAQLASAMGWALARRPSRKCPSRYQCLCGRVQRSPALCKDCNSVQLPCGHCARTVRRTVESMLRLFEYRDSTTVYCDARCWAADAPRRLIGIEPN